MEENPTKILIELVNEVKTTRMSLNNITARIDRFETKSRDLDYSTEKISLYTGRLQRLLDSLPIIMEMKINEKDQDTLQKIVKWLYLIKTAYYLAAGILIFSVFNLVYVNKLAVDWYKEANRSEKEFLISIEKQNRTVVGKDYLRELEQNTTMLQQFIKKKPKDAEKLLDFQSGYQSKK